MSTVWAQFGEAVLEYETKTMPSANVPPVSDQVWKLMTPGMQEVSKELNALFNRVPAWDKGYPGVRSQGRAVSGLQSILCLLWFA